MVHSLIVGNGEIGSAVLNVLKLRTEEITCCATDIKDPDFLEVLEQGCEIMHICFPYQNNLFLDDAIKYINLAKPEIVIIHSTVQVGTTKHIDSRVDAYVVHSPVQGQHPDLTESIVHFQKVVGTPSVIAFEEVAKEFPNVECVHINNPDATELGKLLSTSYYGLCIAWTREMKIICDEFNVDFDDSVTKMNEIYNEGYQKFKPNVIRPILTPPSGSIGGHCVVQNAMLLQKKIDSVFLRLIR